MSQTALEQLEQYKQRLSRANDRATQVKVKLEAARQQYNDAVAQAKETHKTADLDKLREILVKQEAENTAAVADFVRAVEDFEGFVKRMEEAMANPEALAALLASMPKAEPAAAVAPAETSAAAVAFDEDDI